jgi:hypothetical protein
MDRKKVEAARQAKGYIELESDSAEQIKHTIEQVGTITSSDDKHVEFEGRRIVEGHGFGRAVNCYDIFETPNGFLLHTYINDGPNWAVAGKTLEDMLAAAPDRSVAKRAHGELVKKYMISIKH